jgi:hypothetical protein
VSFCIAQYLFNIFSGGEPSTASVLRFTEAKEGDFAFNHKFALKTGAQDIEIKILKY